MSSPRSDFASPQSSISSPMSSPASPSSSTSSSSISAPSRSPPPPPPPPTSPPPSSAYIPDLDASTITDWSISELRSRFLKLNNEYGTLLAARPMPMLPSSLPTITPVASAIMGGGSGSGSVPASPRVPERPTRPKAGTLTGAIPPVPIPPSPSNKPQPSPKPTSARSSTSSIPSMPSPSLSSQSSQSSQSSEPIGGIAAGIGLSGERHPHTLHFGQDSPFFRRDLYRHADRVEALGARLKRLISSSKEFCQATKSFESASRTLGHELSLSWSEIEMDGDEDEDGEKKKEKGKETPAAISLGSSLGKMGQMLATLADISGNLSMSLDTLLVNSMVEFRTKYIKTTAAKHAMFDRVADEYQKALDKRLSRKSQPKTNSLSSPLNAGNGTGTTSSSLTSWGRSSAKKKPDPEEDIQREQAQLVMLARQFELVRFDFMQLLNDVRTLKRLELIEMVCASFLAFITFFHEGMYMADTIKNQIDRISSHIQHHRPQYQTENKIAEQQREMLDAILYGSWGDWGAQISATFVSDHRMADTQVMRRGKNVKIEREGYLRKQSSSLKKDWKRRWFILQNGQLFYVRDHKDVSPQHVVNVLICTVRISQKAELDYCFDLISPNKRVYTLQAESEEDMKDWMSVFANCAESLMTGHQTGLTSQEKQMSTDTLSRRLEEKEAAIASLTQLNPYCADCNSKDPDWSSINLGIMICIECSGIHRQMGVHISKVRSLTLDTWTKELLDLMVSIGNTRLNTLYEQLPTDFVKPTSLSSREEREEFIVTKYMKKAFLNKNVLSGASNAQQQLKELHRAVATNNIDELLILNTLGADLDWRDPDNSLQSALHIAAQHDAMLACEYLLQNNASDTLLDAQGRTALDVAIAAGSTHVQARLASRKL